MDLESAVEDRILNVQVFGSHCTEEEEVVSSFNIAVKSSILAQKSSYFEKLFSSGLKESTQKSIDIQIPEEEMESFSTLLKSMDSNDVLTSQTSLALLQIIIVADKFVVPSCLGYCCQLLLGLPMTMEVAMCCLGMQTEFDPNALICQYMLPVFKAAKEFVLAELKEVDKCEAQISELPLYGLEIILSSDCLEASTDGSIFNVAVSWVKKKFKKLEERRDALKGLMSHIRLPMMSADDLRNLLHCNELGPLAQKIVLEALFHKVEGPIRHAGDKKSQFVQRSYQIRPVKVLELELPYPVCTTYWDVSLDQVTKMCTDGEVHSEKFHFMQDVVEVYVGCSRDKKSSGLFLGMMITMTSTTTAPYTIEYEFACRRKPSQDFVSLFKDKYSWRKDGGNQMKVGKHKLVAWDQLVCENSPYFINGVMYIRIGIRTKNSAGV